MYKDILLYIGMSTIGKPCVPKLIMLYFCEKLFPKSVHYFNVCFVSLFWIEYFQIGDVMSNQPIGVAWSNLWQSNFVFDFLKNIITFIFLENWNSRNFNFQSALEDLHFTYWTDVFFTFWVGPDDKDTLKNVLQVS